MGLLSVADRFPVKRDHPTRIVVEPLGGLGYLGSMADDDDDAATGIYVGEYLKKLMAEAGIERPQLVELSGVSYSHLSNLVNDEKPLTAKTAIKLAGPLGMDVAELMARGPLIPEWTGTVDALGIVTMQRKTLLFIQAEAEIAGLCQRGSLLRFVRTTLWVPGAWQLVEVAGMRRLVQTTEDGFTTVYGETVARSKKHKPLGELVEVRFYPQRIKSP